MNIEKNTVVTMDYTLTDEDGAVIDSSEGREPLQYLHGTGTIIPGLENALEGKPSGDKVSTVIQPEEGYGLRDESKIFNLARNQFSGVDEIEPGMQFQTQIQDAPTILTVRSIEGDQVTVDANHPLAGMTLHFDINIKDVREASEDEINQQQS